MAKNVTLYTADWCPWCQKAKDFLLANNVKFVTKDVDEPLNAEEALKKSGQTSIPVIDIDGNIVVGFDMKRLKELLAIK